MSLPEKLDFNDVRWASVEWTLLCTLYLRACESRLSPSILGDRAAAEAVDRINYDFARMRRWVLPATNQFLVALRAWRLDVWSAEFLNRHPDAVVLHLGCGLDSRVFRLAPPRTVQWFDVDQPDVIKLRRQLYSERDGYRMIGSSVTEIGWLEQIPADGPTLVIAEGLLMYLTESQVRDLLARITDRFHAGELLADIESRWGPRTSKLIKWGTGDGRELTRWNGRLHHIEDTSTIADYAKIRFQPQRALFRMLHALPAVRDFDRLYRFAF